MITLVTGNPNKLKEIQALAPPELQFTNRSIDLDEIQSMDLRKIVDAKVRAAYAEVGSAVMVEDVSLGLDAMAGLPGPFYKFFHQEMTDGVLLPLAKAAGSPKVTIRCMTAYYDGKQTLYGLGEINGIVVEARGENGFGFDPYIIPEGETRTMAEMSPEEKHAMSHRGLAFRDLFKQLAASQ